MSNQKLLIILNPKSGKGKIKTDLLEIVSVFSAGGYDVTVYPTSERLDATAKAQSLKSGEYALVVVCGGDGTLNEVVTGLMNSGEKIPIGYIPYGTLNEWSSGLHISRDPLEAATDILNGQKIELDIGKFGEKYFTYTASFGAFTEVSYSAPQEFKNAFGQAAYFFEGIKSLGNIKPIHLKFEWNGGTREDDYIFGAVSNSMSVGGIVKFDENAVKLNDGLFEVMLVKFPDNILKLQPIIDGLLKQDLDREGIEFFHASSLSITLGKDVSWTLDGEYAPGNEKVEIKNLHSAIHLIAPVTRDLL